MFRTVQMFAVVCAALLLVCSGQLQAAPVMGMASAIEWDPAPIGTGDPLDDLMLTIMGLPTTTATDLSVTFMIRADLNDADEFVTMSIDGFSFGIWLNEVLGDDTIDGPAGDAGGDIFAQSKVIFTGTATIPLAMFAPLIADGMLIALFDFSPGVADLALPPFNPGVVDEEAEFAKFEISYSTPTQPPGGTVPEPGSLAIFVIGALGMGIGGHLRRRRNKQA